jgi:hypothetical protein
METIDKLDIATKKNRTTSIKITQMKKYVILSMMLLFVHIVSAQYQNRNWIFGRPFSGATNATLFFGDQPVPINPVINLGSGQPNSIATSNGNEQWAVVTNPFTGAVVLYTDGKSVFDHQHNLVSSFDLGGNVSSVQPVAIAPVPRSDLKSNYNQYYIFTNGTGSFMASYQIGKVTYRVYDYLTQTFGPLVNLPGPYGMADVTEGMKIIPSDSDPDILWLVVSLFPTTGYETKYVVYKIDKNIVTYHADFDFGPQKSGIPGSGASPIIYITYSRANTIGGITNVGFSMQYTPAVFTCEFDNLNGQFLTNTVKSCNTGYSSSIPTIYNLEFSPNGRFLYYSVYRTTASANALFQVDLQDASLTPTLIKSFSAPYAGGLKQGPDSLIYHIHDDGYNSQVLKVGRLLQPDVKFVPGITPINQFYEENFKTFSGVFGIGLCEFLVMPYVVPIPPNGLEDMVSDMQSVVMQVSPNPAVSILSVDFRSNAMHQGVIRVADLYGKLIYESPVVATGTHQIDLANFPAGVYNVKASFEHQVLSRKIIITK